MTSLNIESWSPKAVSQWIKGLGPQYETYSESFIDEEITGKALLTINAEYLTELSIENVIDQNAILDAVHCLVEVDTCLKGETVFGQVVIVNDETKALIDKLEQESQDASEGDVKTSESSTKLAGHVYQLAKKLLSWLIRSPFSEMNACWPLKDSVCRVVRDMTDESLLKNREHLQENLKKLQISFDNFLNEEPLHEVFKQPPILVNEEFTLEGEGLGIGITTSHHIHTVNSVTAESPAGKNGNIKNGDEIVNVNGECVIAWPQKNVITLMKSKADSVSLTLKKLPLVKGPLNKPLDKPGTPLSEMNVIMDRTKVAPERQARVEMKEAGIKEETSLEMQAFENETTAEESSKVEDRIEGIKEEVENEGKQKEKKDENGELENVENVPEQESVTEEKKESVEQDAPAGDDKAVEKEIKTETKDDGLVENGEVEKQEESSKEVENETSEKEENGDEKKTGKVTVGGDLSEESKDKTEGEKPDAEVENNVETVTSDLETSVKSEVASGDGVDGGKVEVNGDYKGEVKEQKKEEENGSKQDSEEKVLNGEAEVETQNESERAEGKKTEEISDVKSKSDENDAKIEVKVDSPKEEVKKPSVTENGDNGTVSPSKKPTRPELPKMKIGSVKNVTVGGASAKQVEVYGTSKVVRREKKIDGAPNKRISCIELGDADCEGWLTKKSGGHGLTPTRWRRQWCVLKEEHLYYYKTSFDREAGGVIVITGYNMSAAPEIKKPFSFKCEKEGAKKYFFHADNEVDREMWITNLNSASRGERKLKETGAQQMHEATEHKSSVSLKPAPSNRPRTGSVLAGIRFNYYDDDDDKMEENRKVNPEASQATTTAQRVNEGVLNGPANGTKPSTAVDENTGQNVLKIAAGVEEDLEPCQVIPVEEIEKADGESQEKNSKVEPKDESCANVDSSEDKVDNEAIPGVKIETDQANEEPVAQDVSKDEVSTTEDTSGPKEDREELKGDVPTHEVSVEASAADGESEITKDTKESEETNEDVSKTEETEAAHNTTVEDQKAEHEVNEQSEAGSEVPKGPEDAKTKSEDDTAKCDDGSAMCEDDSEKCEDVTTKSEDDAAKSEDLSKCEDSTAKCEDGTAKCEGVTTKSEDDAVKSDDVAKSEDGTTTCEYEAGTSEEKTKDDFQDVADSIKEAEIGIDGSERSPEALLRRLSVNSQSEIMDKVVQLRVLRQNLKDKEQSIGVIDELLSSDVTPESIAEWRAKYETITNSNSNSSDLNENSQL